MAASLQSVRPCVGLLMRNTKTYFACTEDLLRPAFLWWWKRQRRLTETIVDSTKRSCMKLSPSWSLCRMVQPAEA